MRRLPIPMLVLLVMKKKANPAKPLAAARGTHHQNLCSCWHLGEPPLKRIWIPGQRSEMTQAQDLTQEARHTVILGDKDYDSRTLIHLIENQGCKPIISTRRNRRTSREIDEHIYKERHLIECFFGFIKHYRRVFFHFDKTALVCLDFLQCVSTFIWLK